MSDTPRIANYAMIGDLRTGALVHRDGTIAWSCLPRFDSDALFAALVGDEKNGAWHLAPVDVPRETSRRYIDGTLVLETTFATPSGSARLIDFMPIGAGTPAIVRVVEGVSGTVAFGSKLRPRMKYGLLAPWTRTEGDAWTARVAPDGICLRTTVTVADIDHAGAATFGVTAGQRIAFVVQWFDAAAAIPERTDAEVALASTVAWWQTWSAGFAYDGSSREVVLRSAIALKALTSGEHGSYVAALTTSLPEKLGGEKNWDYRYTWLRDGSFSTEALLRLGFVTEAEAWRDWFLRVCAGQPEHLHIMYGTAGEWLDLERALPWLSGFAGSQPIRVSNAAHAQFQLGIYGDVIASLEHAQRAGVPFDTEHWSLIEPLLEFLDANWQRPGNGIWERRGGEKQYVDSKLMVWVAFDRALKMAERGGFPIDASRWNQLMARIHAQICSAGFDAYRNTFTQSYGSSELDASLLLLVILGFLPADDPRIIGTVAAIEAELLVDGYVYRYTSDDPRNEDGSPSEGAFAMCGFWLVQAYTMMGRLDDARTLFARLAATANDVGLLSEEFDVARGVAIGNFPQAFSHAGLIDAAHRLSVSKAG